MESSTGIYVQLLGTSRIRLGQTWYAFVPEKRYQLLAYLAYYGDWVSRERAAFLFWPDVETQHAKQNLRGLLQRVRALEWLPDLEANTHQLRWAVPTDVVAFRRAIEQNSLDEALSVYAGPLLQDLESDEAPEFSEWLTIEREHLHTQWRNLLLKRVEELQTSGQEGEAARLLSRLLENDPLDEEAVQAYMGAAAQAGQQEEALRAHRRFSKRLSDELGMEPTSTTQRLAQAIQDTQVERPPQEPFLSHATPATPSPVSPAPNATPSPKPASLPTASTPFVGRDLELGDIMHLLTKPECRLLTLIGAGGVGKTRLALQVASELKQAYEDGTYFIPLDALTSTAAIPVDIATVLGLELQGQSDPLAQVSDSIGDKHLLLVLDNFEHLLEGATVTSSLLQSCPQLTLLVTSRERLNLEEEWLFSVEGLTYPEASISLEKSVAYDAVQLFTQRAQRLQPIFRLTEENLPFVLKICQLVQGLPLGLELAAAWVRVMPVEEIALEIEQNLDFLASQSRNVNERHRSIRAAFGHSWSLLSAKEQEVLRKLAVFRGGFRREAAAVVADAPVAVLAALVDKSLLRLSPTGRYDRHPLLYQYTQEKLAEHPEERADAQERHGKYYVAFLRHQEANLSGQDQKRALLLVEEELENLRSAWDWLVDWRPGDLQSISEPFSHYFNLRGRYKEGAEFFSQVVTRLENTDAASRDDRALGDALVHQAWFCMMISDFETSRDLAQRGLKLVSFPEDCIAVLVGHNTLAAVSSATGSYIEANQYRKEISGFIGEARDKGYLPPYLANLALAANLGNTAGTEKQLGNYAEAQRYYEQALQLNRQIGHHAHTASNLANLGELLLRLDKPAEALPLLQEGLQLAQEMELRGLIPWMLNVLATAHLKLGELAKAQELCQQALQAAQESENVTAVAGAFLTQGRITAQVDVLQAKSYFVEALRLSWRHQETPMVLNVLVHLAELWFKQGQTEQAGTAVSTALSHPAIEQESKERALQLLEQLRRQLSPEAVHELLESSEGETLVELVNGILQQNTSHM